MKNAHCTNRQQTANTSSNLRGITLGELQSVNLQKVYSWKHMLVQLQLYHIWSRSVMRTTIQSYLLCKGMHDIVGCAWARALSIAQPQATEWHKSTCTFTCTTSTRRAQHRNCLVTYGQYRCCTLVQHTMCSAKHKKAWKHTLAILLLAKLQRSLCGPLIVIVVDSGDSIFLYLE